METFVLVLTLKLSCCTGTAAVKIVGYHDIQECTHALNESFKTIRSVVEAGCIPGPSRITKEGKN